MREGLFMVLACAYNDVKYSPHPFPGAVAVAVADDTKWDMYAMALSIPYSLATSCFSMLGKVLWQVKSNGQAPPLTEDLHLGLASNASTEEGVNIVNVPVIGGQSQEQKEEEQVEEMTNNCDKAGLNTLALPCHTVIDMTLGVAP